MENRHEAKRRCELKEKIVKFIKSHWLFLLLAVLPSLLLIIKGYSKYGSLFIDCGRDVVIPWRLSDGEVLYRDIRYVYGPLAPYLNLLLFKIAGLHLDILRAAGTATFFSVLTFVYLITRRFIRQEFAAAAAAFFALQLGLKQLHPSDIFNFVFPYSYALIYGTAFSLCLLLFSLRYLSDARLSSLFLASAGLAGALVSKGEIAISCACYYLVFLATVVISKQNTPPFRPGKFFVAALALPFSTLLFIYLYFTARLDVFHYLKKQIFFHNEIWQRYMNSLSGLDAAGGSLLKIAENGAYYLFFIVLLFFLGYLSKNRIGAAGAAVLAAPALAYLFSRIIDFRAQYGSLLLIFIIAAFFVIRDFIRGKSPYPLFLILVFTALFTWRRLLNCDTGHISYCILIPGLIFYHIFFLGVLPGRLKISGAKWLIPVFFVALGAIYSYRAFVQTSQIFELKGAELRTPRGNQHMIKETFRVVGPLFNFLQNHADPQEELVVFPEGALLNFLSGRKNRLFNIAFTPPEVAYEQAEESIIDYLESRKVKYVCIVGRRTDEYGLPVFGRDYLQALQRYLHETYRGVRIFGAHPFSGPAFGAVLLERNRP